MPFQKGHKPVVHGQGRTNLRKLHIQSAFEKIIEKYVLTTNTENTAISMLNDMNKVNPTERLRFITDLASYVLPKQRAVDVTTAGNPVDHNLVVNFSIKPDAVDMPK